MSSFQLANEIAALMGGRRPEWRDQESWSGPPTDGSAGVDLRDAIMGLGLVALRVQAHRRAAIVTIPDGGFDAGATYVVTLNGQAIEAGGEPTVAEALSQLHFGVQADETVGGAAGDDQVVTSRRLDEDGNVTAVDEEVAALEILGTVPADYSIAVSASGGAGGEALACEADAVAAKTRLWGYPDTRRVAASVVERPERWYAIAEGLFEVGSGGLVERLEIGGLGRLYLEVFEVAGHEDDGEDVVQRIAAVHVGPCRREDG